MMMRKLLFVLMAMVGLQVAYADEPTGLYDITVKDGEF